MIHAIPCTLKRIRVPHKVESGEPCTAKDRNKYRRTYTKLPEGVGARIFRVLLSGVPRQIDPTRHHSCRPVSASTSTTCMEAVLMGVDQLPLHPRGASLGNTLDRDKCPPSSGGGSNYRRSRWKYGKHRTDDNLLTDSGMCIIGKEEVSVRYKNG